MTGTKIVISKLKVVNDVIFPIARFDQTDFIAGTEVVLPPPLVRTVPER